MTAPKKPKLILASASPRRLRLLEQIGIKPDKILAAEIDETWPSGESPLKHVKRLAFEKAEIFANKYPQDFILAADTIVLKGNRILGKPENRRQAEDFLKILSGGRHRVITSVCLLGPGKKSGQKTVRTIVSFKRLNRTEISTYLKSGEWEGKAGAYAIQGRAGAFVKSINGSYSNVVGLPLYETWCLLSGLGYNLQGS